LRGAVGTPSQRDKKVTRSTRRTIILDAKLIVFP
jgi:hypothetical protein